MTLLNQHNNYFRLPDSSEISEYAIAPPFK